MKVGTYDFGYERVTINLSRGDGGSYSNRPYKSNCPVITIGADATWIAVVDALLHEATELSSMRKMCRFNQNYDGGDDNGNYTFIYTHTQFSQVLWPVAVLLVDCLSDLKKAWGRFK